MEGDEEKRRRDRDRKEGTWEIEGRIEKREIEGGEKEKNR